MPKCGSDIPKQVSLPLGKAVQIALRSLRARLMRSVLTLLTVVVAIAFLSSTWADSLCEPPIQAAALAGQGLTEATAPPAPARGAWLMSLSLLVALVGISNAMLMSVMERFREIGTMKCLGALDSFILKLFLLESTFLGAAGTLAGVALGLLLNLLLLWQRFGGAAWRAMPWPRLAWVGAGSFLIGMAITAAAALYPAWKAARMDPIAAMRVDV